MGDLLKEIFKGVGEKLRTPQVLGLIAIILLVFRTIFSMEFRSLMQIFINGMGKLGFLINIFQLAAVMLFITSAIAFVASIFNIITYLIINEITTKNKKVSKKLLDGSMVMHRFFIGSKIAVVNVNMWLLVACSFFYIFDEGAFNKYKSCILNYTFSTTLLFRVAIAIYILTIIGSLLKLLEGMAFRFLYFRLDEETEKKLYELRDKYSA